MGTRHYYPEAEFEPGFKRDYPYLNFAVLEYTYFTHDGFIDSKNLVTSNDYHYEVKLEHGFI